MLTLRPTLELARKLKLAELEDLPLSDRCLTDWCVRPFRAGRWSFLIFTEALTLYSIIVPQRGITTPAKLRQAFAATVHDHFQGPAIGSAHVSSILLALSDCHFSRCRDRRVLGSINDLVWGAQCDIEAGESLATTNERINETPLSHLGMDSPDRRLKAALSPDP